MMFLKLTALSSVLSFGAVIVGTFVSAANADVGGIVSVIDILCPPSN